LRRSRELTSTLVLITAAAACWWLVQALHKAWARSMRAGLSFGPGRFHEQREHAHALPRRGRAGTHDDACLDGRARHCACAGGVALGGCFLDSVADAEFLAHEPGPTAWRKYSRATRWANCSRRWPKPRWWRHCRGVLWSDRDALVALAAAPPKTGMANGARIVIWDFVLISAATLLIAAIDVPGQLWQHHKKLG